MASVPLLKRAQRAPAPSTKGRYEKSVKEWGPSPDHVATLISDFPSPELSHRSLLFMSYPTVVLCYSSSTELRHARNVWHTVHAHLQVLTEGYTPNSWQSRSHRGKGEERDRGRQQMHVNFIVNILLLLCKGSW